MRLYENQPSGTVVRARHIRRNASAVELRTLRGLKEAFPGLKWRHQAPVGPYFADLLCFSERLVIEVDGATHSETADHDIARTRFIENEGYRVLRFWNNNVMENLEGVIGQISLSLREREGARSAKPSGKGEGDASTETRLPSPFRGVAAPSLSQGERDL